jgi:transcriptional regulator with XRE-family HTH domain
MPKHIPRQMNKFYKLFAEELKKVRQQKGLKQSDVAARLKVKTQTYQQYEYGKHRIDIYNLFELAKALDVASPILFSLARKAYEEAQKEG